MISYKISWIEVDSNQALFKEMRDWLKNVDDYRWVMGTVTFGNDEDGMVFKLKFPDMILGKSYLHD
jgi:hypothetical protein